MIPTARKFYYEATRRVLMYDKKSLITEKALIEFARLHCIEQSQRCYEASRIKIQPKDHPVYLQEEILVRDITDDNKTIWVSVDEGSILNAYSLDKIK